MKSRSIVFIVAMAVDIVLVGSSAFGADQNQRARQEPQCGAQNSGQTNVHDASQAAGQKEALGEKKADSIGFWFCRQHCVENYQAIRDYFFLSPMDAFKAHDRKRRSFETEFRSFDFDYHTVKNDLSAFIKKEKAFIQEFERLLERGQGKLKRIGYRRSQKNLVALRKNKILKKCGLGEERLGCNRFTQEMSGALVELCDHDEWFLSVVSSFDEYVEFSAKVDAFFDNKVRSGFISVVRIHDYFSRWLKLLNDLSDKDARTIAQTANISMYLIQDTSDKVEFMATEANSSFFMGGNVALLRQLALRKQDVVSRLYALYGEFSGLYGGFSGFRFKAYLELEKKKEYILAFSSKLRQE